MSQEITINVGTKLIVQPVEETTEIVAPLDTDLLAMGRGPETVHTTVGDFKAPLLDLVNQSVIGAATPSSSPTGTETNGQSYRVSNSSGSDQTFTNFSGVVVPDQTSGLLTKTASGWGFVKDNLDTTGLMKLGSYTGSGSDLDAAKISKDYLLVDGPNLVDNSYTGALGTTLVTGGGTIANAAYNTTDFMPLSAVTQYTASPWARFVQFYDVNKAALGTMLSNIDTTQPYTTPAYPAGSKYARASFSVSDWASAQFEAGTVATPYQSFGKKIVKSFVPVMPLAASSVDTVNVKDKAIGILQTKFLTPSANLFNKNAADVVLLAILNSNGTVGAPGSNPSLNTSGFIEQKPNTEYTLGSQPRIICFYDKNKNVIGTATNLPNPYPPYTYTTGGTVAYMRWSGSASGTAWSAAMLNTGDTLLPYVAYGASFSSEINTKGAVIPLEWTSEGDSITIQGKWQGAVANALGLMLTNTGVAGTKLSVKLDGNGNIIPDTGTGGIPGNEESMCLDVRTNLIPTTTKVLTLLAGTNDHEQSMPLGALDSLDYSTFNGAFNIWLQKVRGRCKDAQIFICGTTLGYRQGTLPAGWTDSYHNALGLTSLDYGEQLRLQAKRNGLQFINFSAVGYDKYNIDDFILDGLHPNDAGAALMSREAIATMRDRIRLN